MKKLLGALICLALSCGAALAQSAPNPAFYYGFVPTAGQWNSFFQAKQDYLGFLPLNPSSIAGAAPITAAIGSGVVTIGAVLSSGKIYVGNVSNIPEAQTMSGDCVVSISGVMTCTKLNSVSPGTIFPLNIGAGLGSSAGNLLIAAGGVTHAMQANVPAVSFACNTLGIAGAVNDCLLGQGLNFLTATTLLFEPATAHMWPGPSQSASPTVAWNAVDPWGRAISCAGTHSQCFNEFTAATKAAGWSWRIDGNLSLHSTVQLTIPPCFQRKEFIDTGVQLVFDSSLGATDNIVHDTYENCDILLFGSAVQHSGDTGYLWSFAPSTMDSAGNIGGFASTIEVSSGSPASGGSGIKFDTTNGGRIGNRIFVHDMNGGVNGYFVTNPGTAFIADEDNQIEFLYMHGQTGRVVLIGTGTTNQANMRYNSYSYGRLDPGTGATAGLETWETYGLHNGLNVTNETASATFGLTLNSGAVGNRFVGGALLATTPLNDLGSCNSFVNVIGVSAIQKYVITSGGCGSNNAPFPGYQSGVYITGRVFNASSPGTLALSANVLYAMPLVMDGPATWTSLNFNVTATGTATLCRLGIFNNDYTDGAPGTLLLDAGTVGVGGTGVAAATISQFLNAQSYYAVVVCNGSVTVNAVTVGGNNDNVYMNSIGVTAFNTGAPDALITRAFTFGVLSGASPFGAITRSAASIPLIAVKK